MLLHHGWREAARRTSKTPCPAAHCPGNAAAPWPGRSARGGSGLDAWPCHWRCREPSGSKMFRGGRHRAARPWRCHGTVNSTDTWTTGNGVRLETTDGPPCPVQSQSRLARMHRRLPRPPEPMRCSNLRWGPHPGRPPHGDHTAVQPLFRQHAQQGTPADVPWRAAGTPSVRGWYALCTLGVRRTARAPGAGLIWPGPGRGSAPAAGAAWCGSARPGAGAGPRR